MPRRARRSMAQINVVPYIDVMLVLLVIFMVAAPMMQPGKVDLPSVARANREQSQKHPIMVELSKEGRLTLKASGKKGVDRPMRDIEELIVAIKAESLTEKRPVVISADKDSRLQAVMDVRDKLTPLEGQGNIDKVSLSVMPRR